MVRYSIITVGMAGMALALPLNINLGAYSPALVVGDGEISFGGQQDVSNLMNVLEGAAVNAASNVASASTSTTTSAAKAEGGGSSTNAAAANDAAASAAAVANDPILQEQAQAITSNLQGLGKAIAPREGDKDVEPRVVVESRDVEMEVESASKAKRDLSGFDRALKYAEAALVKGPKIQLGTGVEGSGVGIIVDNNQEAAARAGKGAEKRSEDAVAESAPKRVRAKVTTMYVRSGIPASLRASNVARDAGDSAPAVPRSVPVSFPATLSSTSRRDVIDGLNLNVDGNEGLTMTFVETVEDGDDE